MVWVHNDPSPKNGGFSTILEPRRSEKFSARKRYNLPVAPVAYQVILEPGIGQFREFEPRRVNTRINSLGLFLVHKLTCGKREERGLLTLDEQSTSRGIAEPYAR